MIGLKRKSEERELRPWIEQTEAAETILADFFSGVGIIDVDEHVLFRMTGEKAREDFDELFLFGCACMDKSITDVQAVRPFGTIQSDPIAGAIVADLVQPLAVFRYPRVDFLEA